MQAWHAADDVKNVAVEIVDQFATSESTIRIAAIVPDPAPQCFRKAVSSPLDLRTEDLGTTAPAN